MSHSIYFEFFVRKGRMIHQADPWAIFTPSPKSLYWYHISSQNLQISSNFYFCPKPNQQVFFFAYFLGRLLAAALFSSYQQPKTKKEMSYSNIFREFARGRFAGHPRGVGYAACQASISTWTERWRAQNDSKDGIKIVEFVHGSWKLWNFSKHAATDFQQSNVHEGSGIHSPVFWLYTLISSLFKKVDDTYMAIGSEAMGSALVCIPMCRPSLYHAWFENSGRALEGKI